tara:strand:+ start:3446 stop:4255 length:810 start_codon:yes stop_codon:yes gene_type:complete
MQKASLCRHFENNVYELVANKKIKYPVYLSTGQEYIPSTIAEISNQKKIKPMLFGQHRCHSLYLSFGGNIEKLILELLGDPDGCTYGMGGSLSIHSEKINMYGHDGFLGSNVCIGVGACFSTNKPTIVFMGDSTIEEDHTLASLGWASTRNLPILFIVEDNNYAILTEKKERRNWEASEVSKGFKIESYDLNDNPFEIKKILNKKIFTKPLLLNIHTNRLTWHVGAGIDEGDKFDRLSQQINILGDIGKKEDLRIKTKIDKLWQKNLEK